MQHPASVPRPVPTSLVAEPSALRATAARPRLVLADREPATFLGAGRGQVRTASLCALDRHLLFRLIEGPCRSTRRLRPTNQVTWSRYLAEHHLSKYQWYHPQRDDPDAPSLRKGWAYYEHVTLPRRLDDEGTYDRRAMPGDPRPTRLYDVVRTTHESLSGERGARVAGRASSRKKNGSVSRQSFFACGP